MSPKDKVSLTRNSDIREPVTATNPPTSRFHLKLTIGITAAKLGSLQVEEAIGLLAMMNIQASSRRH